MSASQTDPATLLHDETAAAPRHSTPGEAYWSIRQPDGTTLTCELRDHGQWGVEVELCSDGEPVFHRQWPDRSSAVIEIDDMQNKHIRNGGILLPEAEPSASQNP